MIPDPSASRELSERMAGAITDNISFFKRHGVRIVNMSWGESVKDIEKGLEGGRRC